MPKLQTSALTLWSLATLLATSACSGPDRTPAGDGGPPIDLGPTPPDLGPPGCTSTAACADAIDCTTDSCDTATGACRHVLTPALCAYGESCNLIALSVACGGSSRDDRWTVAPVDLSPRLRAPLDNDVIDPERKSTRGVRNKAQAQDQVRS